LKQDKINLAAVRAKRRPENGGVERKDWTLTAAGRALERVLHYSDEGVGVGEIFRVTGGLVWGRRKREGDGRTRCRSLVVNQNQKNT
jgi:hypothetical protein